MQVVHDSRESGSLFISFYYTHRTTDYEIS